MKHKFEDVGGDNNTCRCGGTRVDPDHTPTFEGNVTITFCCNTSKEAKVRWARLIEALQKSGTAYAADLKITRRAMTRII